MKRDGDIDFKRQGISAGTIRKSGCKGADG